MTVRGVVLLLLLSAGASYAQAPDSVRLGYPLRGIPNGLPLREVTALSVVVSGQRRTGPTSSQEMLLETRDGRPALLVVQTSNTPRGTMVDSVWSDPNTLHPLRHVASGLGRNVEARYSNGEVQVRFTAAGKPDSLVTGSAAGRFDFSMAGEVMSRLPIRAGYRAVLLTYDVEHGPRSIALSVQGDTAVSPAAESIPVFVVQLDFGTHVTTQYLEKQTLRSVLWSASQGQLQMWGATTRR